MRCKRNDSFQLTKEKANATIKKTTEQKKKNFEKCTIENSCNILPFEVQQWAQSERPVDTLKRESIARQRIELFKFKQNALKLNTRFNRRLKTIFTFAVNRVCSTDSSKSVKIRKHLFCYLLRWIAISCCRLAMALIFIVEFKFVARITANWHSVLVCARAFHCHGCNRSDLNKVCGILVWLSVYNQMIGTSPFVLFYL